MSTASTADRAALITSLYASRQAVDKKIADAMAPLRVEAEGLDAAIQKAKQEQMAEFAEAKQIRVGDHVRFADGSLGVVSRFNHNTWRNGPFSVPTDDTTYVAAFAIRKDGTPGKRRLEGELCEVTRVDGAT